MANAIYAPLNGVSNKVIKIYAPLNGVSDNVVKGYCSVDGLSKLFFGSGGKTKFWEFYETVKSKIFMQLKLKATPSSTMDYAKTSDGINYYAWVIDSFGEQGTTNNLIPVLLARDTSYYISGVSSGTSVDITYKGDIWHLYMPYKYGNVQNYIYAPRCLSSDKIFHSNLEAERLKIAEMLLKRIYANCFTQNYQVNSTYNLNITSKENTIRRIAGIFLFKTIDYKTYSTYKAFNNNLNNIVEDALKEGLMYNVVGATARLEKDSRMLEFDVTYTSTSPENVNVTYIYNDYNGNGYDICGTNKSYGGNKIIRYWYNNNDDTLHKQTLTSGYVVPSNIGVTINNLTNLYTVAGSNVGVDYYNYLTVNANPSSYIQFASLKQYYNPIPYVTSNGFFHYASKTSLTDSPSVCKDGSIILYAYKSGTYAIYFEALSKSPFYNISGRTNQGGTPTGSSDSNAITYNGITYYRSQLTWMQQSNPTYDEKYLKIVDEPSTQYISDTNRFLWEVAYMFFDYGQLEPI